MLEVYTTHRLSPLSIRSVFAHRLTDTHVIIDGKHTKYMKLTRNGAGTKYHATWAEAHAQLVKYQEDAITQAKTRLDLIRGMTP